MARIQIVIELVTSCIYIKIAEQSTENLMKCVGGKQHFN